MICHGFILYGQGVAINVDGTEPDPSAMLDVLSTSRGFLTPRMTTAQRTAITSPADGLLVYDLTTASFWYYKNSAWSEFPGTSGGWTLNGNSGTVSGTNFIGTTDAQALDIRTNNVIHARITTKGQIETFGTGYSVFLGEGAGENDDLTNNYNVFVGYKAGFSNTAGLYNTANGALALYANTTGSENTANGYQALYSNTTGHKNTANGYYALLSNNTGIQNTANGVYALNNNTTGSYNTANGMNALYNNRTGSNATALGFNAMYYSNNTATAFTNYNVAVGYEALRGSTTASANTGNYNTALGYQTLWSNTTGNQNTANGMNALNSNTTGDWNTALGYYAFYTGTAYTNSMALGYGASITASNQVRIGNIHVSSIGGYAAWTNLSDGRFKKEVKESVPGLAFISKLRPVTYYMDMDALASFLKTPDSLRLKEAEAIKSKMLMTGFIAQEVEAAAQELDYDFSGVDKPKNADDYYGLRYAGFTVPLVKAVQEQQVMIEKLSTENNKLKTEMKSLKTKHETLQTDMESQKTEMESLKTLVKNLQK